MYLPSHFEEPRVQALHRIVHEHPLGMLVRAGATGLDADHLPLLLDAAQGPHGTLVGHVARANPLWQAVADGAAVMVVFRGAQGYVSPNWYPGKQQTHRYVPTWNYEAVHVHGTLHARDDEAFVRAVVGRLTRRHEAGQPTPWKMSDAPADYLAQLMAHIVGIEIRITRLEGKRKLNQNHRAEDRQGAIDGLRASGQQALAQAMEEAAEGAHTRR